MKILSALLFLALFASVNIASAANCRVTKTADTNDGSCTVGDCSLREAVAAPKCSLIDFSLDLSGQTITLTLGEISINRSLHIKGWGAETLAISGNQASRIFYTALGTNVTISGVTMKDGRGVGAFSMEGGAILAHGGLTLDGVYLTGNQAPGRGGAVAFRNLDAANLFNSTVAYNLSTSGPLDAAIVGDATIYNSTIANNQGPGFATDAVALIVNSTIKDNGAFGVAFAFGGRPTVANSVLQDVFLWDIHSGIQSEGNNIITMNPSSLNVPALRPSDQFNVDSMLGPLALNGGHTMTQAPLPGSTTIDRGSNATATTAGLTTDQRGFLRFFDGDGNGSAVVDIGAFEFNSVASAAPVTVAGRVLGAVSGNPLRSQTVTITDMLGNSRVALSSSLGWFVFDNLPAGFVYRVRVNARRGPVEKTVFADQNLTDADIFVPGL